MIIGPRNVGVLPTPSSVSVTKPQPYKYDKTGTAISIFGTPSTAVVSTAYSFVPFVYWGADNKTFSISGSLPTGFVFSTVDGSITGNTTATGTFAVTITVTDSTGSASLNANVIVVSTVEAASYLNRMSTKPAAQAISILDTMISSIRSSSAWAKLDGLYFMANDTYHQSLINIVGDYPLTVAGSPVFTPRVGITGSTNASLTNAVLLNSNTFTNFSTNSAHAGVFVVGAGTATTPVVGTIANFTLQIQPRSASNNMGGYVNNSTTMAVGVASRVGHTTVSRTANNASAIYRNAGAAAGTSAGVPTTVAVSPIYLFRDAGNYSNDQVAAFHFGAGLTQAENQTVYSALNTAINAMSALGAPTAASSTNFDLIVYGGTLAGLMAAQRASNRGARVAIVEPTPELGGVGHNGLTYFDLALRGAYLLMNGGTNNFFKAINAVYSGTGPAQKAEPKVYDQVFANTLTQTRATTFLSSPLTSVNDVKMSGSNIVGIKTASGWIYAPQFVDTSYEMDLAVFAGVPYQVGREANTVYSEPSAGFYARSAANGGVNYSTDNISVNNLYPVKSRLGHADGSGDGLIQPMSFRFPITTASDRIPFPVPPGGYIASKMDQLVAVIVSKNIQQFYSVIYLGGDTALQNNKFCINNNLIPSVDLPGPQARYPDGTWAQRQDVIDEVKSWTLHVLYCLQNDTRINSTLRTNAAAYGLCNDEFVSNTIKGFPNYPYIRESRRLKGKYVLTQNDLYTSVNVNNISGGTRNNSKANRVGQWNYILDSHVMELYPDGTTSIVGTGNIGGPYSEVDTYDIPFTALHTDPAARGHVSNLTVPLAFSASSVAWMPSRMEPNYAQLAEASGEAAIIAIEDSLDIANVPYTKLSRRLGSPVNTVLPVVTGVGTVGQVLSCTTGTWNFSPTTYGYQWKRNGTSISGATSATYTLVSDDLGTTITCASIATNLVSAAQAVSNGIAITS